MALRALLLATALLAYFGLAAGAEVVWLSPVLDNNCDATCAASNNPSFPELYLEAVRSEGRTLCRLFDGRIGHVMGKGTLRGCYTANVWEERLKANDKCPKRAPRQPYECSCQRQRERLAWVPFAKAAERCSDPRTTYTFCRVRKPTNNPASTNYGIGQFKGRPDRCVYNTKEAQQQPGVCQTTVATAAFDILCMEPKRA